MNLITSTPYELMQQAADTSHLYMNRAVKDIDERFGEGFSEKNPILVGLMTVASAIDYHTTMSAAIMQDTHIVLTEITRSLDKVAEAVDGSDALYGIASSIERASEVEEKPQ